MKLTDLPASYQEQVRKQLGISTPALPVQQATPARQSKGPNKTELAYRREVLDTNKDISLVAYEGLTFRLANGHRYTPDWIYWLNGELHCVEVKGSYKFHSHQRARLAFDQAAVEWPNIVWIWATRDGGAWKIYTPQKPTNGAKHA